MNFSVKLNRRWSHNGIFVIRSFVSLLYPLIAFILRKIILSVSVILIIIMKKYWQCKAGRGRLTPYQSEDPSPTLPTYRGKEEKGKIVEDKKGDSN